jgi:hypothetical protein
VEAVVPTVVAEAIAEAEVGVFGTGVLVGDAPPPPHAATMTARITHPIMSLGAYLYKERSIITKFSGLKKISRSG